MAGDIGERFLHHAKADGFGSRVDTEVGWGCGKVADETHPLRLAIDVPLQRGDQSQVVEQRGTQVYREVRTCCRALSTIAMLSSTRWPLFWGNRCTVCRLIFSACNA